MPTSGKSRRAYLASLGVAAGFGLAGCGGENPGGDDGNGDGGNGNGNGGGGNGDGDTETTEPMDGDTPTPEPVETTADPGGTETTVAASGSVTGTVRNDLTGIAVADHVSRVTDEGQFEVTMTIENTGDQEMGFFEHDFDAVFYDSGGAELARAAGWTSYDGEPAPGETADLVLTARELDAEAVASYELVLTCGTFDEGVYCPG